jgi:[glutamine synthetase] adenylyltransferase / [glutamine synthetase]-adenylyl-L-tyrosine phosphorylase
MRERMRSAHPAPDGHFDLKHSTGGMIDAEFAVQYLVLAYSPQHPSLLDNVGNIALMQRAEDVGLLPKGVGHDAAQAYRELRRLQHRARLDEGSTVLSGPALVPVLPYRQAVQALWASVFGQA